jgi:3-deoxy-manno-octulosonate cytidylyltransferase (CMP-KDO synthetase)
LSSNANNVLFKVVIPARFASTRLPGKPLLDIAGKPMVIRVAERAMLSGAREVIVATDDERIYETVQQHGFDVLITQAHHQSGTDRIAEVAEIMAWQDDEIVVNVQGDEPLINPATIYQVAQKLAVDQEAVMSTACFPIESPEDFFNPNVVKVVLNAHSQALYFSRAPIPYPRDSLVGGELKKGGQLKALRHIGLYAYRASFLKKYAALDLSNIEEIESLEQLRVLHHGYKIAVDVLHSQPPMGVDTQEDLEKVRSLLTPT